MSISVLLPENNYNDIICNKVVSETFTATSILNPNPTMEIYGSNSKSDKQKVVTSNGVSYSGSGLISDRINLINSTDVKFEMILTSGSTSGLILVRFGWYNLDNISIGYIFNGNPVYKFVPRGIDETVSVNFTLPWNNVDVSEVTSGTNYTMFFSIYNFTEEKITVKRVDSIPIKFKIFQY
jgi:hypothetical protein